MVPYNTQQLAVPVLKPGPQPWRSSPGCRCRRRGRSAGSSARPCPCSGCCGSRCWRPGSRCPSTSSFARSCANSPLTLRQGNETQRREKKKEKKKTGNKIKKGRIFPCVQTASNNDKWSVNEKKDLARKTVHLGTAYRDSQCAKIHLSKFKTSMQFIQCHLKTTGLGGSG